VIDAHKEHNENIAPKQDKEGAMSNVETAPAATGESRHTLRSTLFGIGESEVDFERRRFLPAMPAVRQSLEDVGRGFVGGYNMALSAGSLDELLPLLDTTSRSLLGFAYEGAAMALALLDLLTFWRRERWRALLDAAPQHTYLIHVGAGWALARLHRRRTPRFLRADPLLWPLTLDGYGFHEGFFNPERTIHRASQPPLLRRFRSGFDQGVGRSLWFVCAADAGRIGAVIQRFDQARRGDLWSGVGLACAYAGGAGPATIAALRDAAAEFLPHMAQGVTFAAKARQRAGNLIPDTDLACSVVCGMSGQEAASVAERTMQGLVLDGDEAAYAEWRRRIREMFTR
jgi:hypothetical protein